MVHVATNVPKLLLVTNDFPPTLGGIQSYLRDFLGTLPPENVVVFASTQDEAAAQHYDRHLEYPVYRWHRKVMLPTPATARRMQEIIAEEGIDTVWFGAAAPLALMAAQARKAGARRVIASTHGHEVGWAMTPVARQLLRVIGNNVDVVTYISDYTLGRIQGAFGSHPAFEHLPSGVSLERFSPPENVEEVRSSLGWDGQLVVLCTSRLVARKGQDTLLKAWPEVLKRHRNARLVIVGQGSYEPTLRKLRAQLGPDARTVSMPGRVSETTMEQMLHGADIFAMPCRTRGYGLDVEGLGIVYLEAQAAGLPVIAGDSGGAPETVTPETAIVVPGGNVSELICALDELLGDAERRKAMALASRRHVEEHWTWEIMGARLRAIVGFS
ncbi:GDP-mannose-dependent monoacylated alpha-(1-6)-phosphatidylinositol monomannoside mannosyltransferase [Corynebacterium pelargi]|uniref:GDP-mannose-dependent alpha-(1-6)-phosphatidylinositol monomannoside mannosyltransferase n=1 Tax=Corynebacterium pelargi TaxID=1471400 RepID=A0A410W7S9_9CORY|nr:GDP-mannose-dependent alpha-(1-6)-phosphatidylinositol monomannoside mannosyltransferase [Corynebacterium pelargi]GGG70790.1 GDP-mannose-dependent monoacylated alpha-(1-6)-phosphatidylinositol monomannoside mannosyltransferase [Corynebacterium pelargi]